VYPFRGSPEQLQAFIEQTGTLPAVASRTDPLYIEE